MRVSLCAIAALCVSLLSPAVMARSERLMGWRYSQVWATSVRLLRVDMKCTVLERDKETGYLLFDCPSGGKSSTGSLEFVRGGEPIRRLLKASVHMERMPSYVESHFLDKLERKLRADYGEPVIPVMPGLSTVKGKTSSSATNEKSKVENEENLEDDEEGLESASEEK